MKKEIRDGKVGVIINNDYGSGWFSWHRDEELLYDPNIIRMIETKTTDALESYLKKKFTKKESLFTVHCDLVVVWLPVGTQFIIKEYDGMEDVWIKNEINWQTA